MIHIAVRVRELVSSNVDSLVDRASNPAKMLGNLCTEIEESLIALHGDLTKAKRRAERCAEKAPAVAAQAEEWTAKAKTAMDHKREDLAHSALLAREDERARAKSLAAEAKEAGEEAAEIEATIATLETKRKEVSARLKSMPGAKDTCSPDAGGDSATDRRLDRIERMERRVGFASDDRAEPAPASVEAEIASLQRDADIAAELAAMKSTGAKKPAAKKRKAK